MLPIEDTNMPVWKTGGLIRVTDAISKTCAAARTVVLRRGMSGDESGQSSTAV